jgi:hypothetical protein
MNITYCPLRCATDRTAKVRCPWCRFERCHRHGSYTRKGFHDRNGAVKLPPLVTRYRSHGIDGLRNKVRKDRGGTSVPPALAEALADLRAAAAALVLVGQPVLKKMLELDIFAPVKTRLTCQLSMPKLSLDDAKEFIGFRLQTAQANPNLFDTDALVSLVTDAKGNRRILMNLAALCLEEAARETTKSSRPKSLLQ